MNNKVILPYIIIEFMPNNIMRFEFTKDVFLNMEKTLEMIDICKNLCPDKLYLSLKIINYKLKMDENVVDFFASGEVRKDMMRLEAVVVNSPSLRIFGNFYLRIKKPQIKTKIFDAESEAIQWLLSN